MESVSNEKMTAQMTGKDGFIAALDQSGGSTPGGGGGGTTTDTALVLMGRGINQNEVREDHGVAQSTGESGPALPEEFRAGLDRYFNSLEKVQ